MIGGRRSAVIALSLVLDACARAPSEEQLDRWLEEARARDREEQARHADDDDRARWTLTVAGTDGNATVLRWDVLDRLAHTEVITELAPEAGRPGRTRFRVALLRDLASTAGPLDPDAEITLVAYDGFRATFAASDVIAHPIGLAVEADGAPIPRASGGPLFTVLPITDAPHLAERYTSNWWVFYVTHLVIDTPPARLMVEDDRPGDDRSALAAVEGGELATLPTQRQRAVVGYRSGWPAEPVWLEGVLVRDVLARRGITLGPGDEVRVTSIAPLTRGEARPTVLTADEVLLRPSMLALRWMPDDAAHTPDQAAPIPARLGGPLTLLVPPEAQTRLGDRAWLTFVDGLVVVHAAP
ncbi:MAG: hypothetical protein OHK0013_01060 [Sandaracinaceae bacterium]